jgi:filamentous hemagglutinin family protein
VATQSWQAVPETAKTAGKKSKSAAGGVIASVALSFSLTGGAHAQAPPAINQLPTGGSVVRGTATIQQTATAQAAAMTVNQTSQRAVVNWNTFNVGSAASVNFVQPNAQAITLNRVNDSNPSQIFGRMTSNGQVVLTNANGIYFAPGSSVDVGAITATTHSITDDNFMSGKYVFERNGATGKIINEGNITAALAGYVALLAPEVQNAGIVVARAGTVAMAAGQTITLNIDGAGSLAGITTTPSAIATLIENKHAVQAPDGQIILSAVALNKLQAGVIKNSGSLEANSLVSKGGKIYLEGDDITLSSTSKLEAKGATGGGTVLVGGDWQGSGEMRQATNVTMTAGATIDASATDKGDGGKVVLWSDVHSADSQTMAHGSIKAEAGPNGGDGGKVETSGHHLYVNDIQVSTQAKAGNTGEWLLDPVDFTIAASGGDMTGAALTALLTGNTDITIQSGTGTNTASSYFGSTGTGGNINVNDAVSWSKNKLTLAAYNNIYINDVMTATGTASLALNYGLGALASGNTSVIQTKTGPNDAFIGKINLPAGTTNFTTKQGSDGNEKSYSVITSLTNAGPAVSASSNYAIGSDITYSGSGLTPFASAGYTGTFDGLGHTVSSLTVNATLANNVGLFNTISTGVVQNLGLLSISINGPTRFWVGSVAGQISDAGTIRNTFATGSISAREYVGGLVGTMSNGTITSSYASVTVNAGLNVSASLAGGLVGEIKGGSITKSYATGNVVAQGDSVGGLVGKIALNSGNLFTISNSYATGSVTGTAYLGGLVGFISSANITSASSISGTYSKGIVTSTNSSSSVAGMIGYYESNATLISVSNNYWDTTTSGKTNGVVWRTINISSPSGFTGFTTAQMQVQSNFSGFDFTTTPIWKMPSNGTPVLCNFQASCVPIIQVYVLGVSGQSSTYGTAPSLSYCYSSSAASCVQVSYTGIPNASQLFDLTGGSVSNSVNVSSGATGTVAVNTNLASTTNAGIYSLTFTPSLTLAGYSFSAGNAVSYTISKANLTQVTASKVYDGLTTVGYGQMTNIVGVLGQSFSATAGTAAISDKNVTTSGKTITSLAGLTLTSANGGNKDNYNLTSNLPDAGAQNSVDISAKLLTVSGLTAPASRIYNATLAAVVSGTPTLSSSEAAGAGTSSDGKPYTGDVISFNGTATGTYDIKDVGATTITFGGLTSSNSNYTFSFGSQAGGITPKALTVSGLAAPASRVYDATLVAAVTGTPTVVSESAGTGNSSDGKAYTGDTVSFNGTATGTYDIKDVGATTITFGGLTSGNNNYTLSFGTQSSSISHADLLVTGITAVNKVYDATRTASLSGTATVNPLGSEVVGVTGTGVGQFIDKNVGTAKTISVTGFTLTGSDAGNYSVVQPNNVTANITQASLTVSGISAQNKVYDGATTATVSTANVVRSGLIAGDVVNISATGNFADKNVGTAKTVNLSSSYSGTDAGNYSITDQATTTADINKAPLTVTAVNAVKNLGDANPALTVALTGFVGGETLATSGVTGTGLATTTATVSTDAGTAAITAAAGTLAASNYAFTNLVDGTLTIRPISALNNTEVSNLIGAQLASLSGAQVGSFSASQLQVFSPQQLNALSPSQLAGMTTLQLLSLSPAQMAAISPAKIASMTVAELGAFTDAQLQALSPTQLAAIAPTNFAAFTPAQIMAMSIAQVQNLSPEQLAMFSPAQIASLNAAELAYFDARQLAAIGIFPKVETPVADNTKATQDVAVASTNTKDSHSKFEAPIPVMTEVATANTSVVATPEPLQVATPVQSAALSPRAVQALLFPPSAESNARTGVLAITILSSAQARPTTAGIAFEQDADTVSLRLTSAPAAVPQMSDKVVFSDKLVTFMVATSSGVMVEFEGSVVNNRMVILAPSAMAKRVARTEMNLVLAAAVTSLGKENRVILAKLDGVVLDLR